ncbi:MAG: excinuclease ABC subunit UvrA [Bacteroidales bacterium]|nr:excinuclease ABC subunit UvrA [Bacteroidales bacterium]
MSDNISVKGARVNNLKNISLDIPRGKFVVITGISGSGKSSLAFDTLFAEGQRRFAESLSSYARQFLGRMSKPDVDFIDGIPPAIAIEQKVSTRNPRSTVATTTEIYDFLRLLFARIGRTYSPVSGSLVHADTVADVMRYLEALLRNKDAGAVYILAGMNWDAREDKTELLLELKEEGYNRLYVEGRPVKIDEVLKDGADSVRDAFLLIDRFSSLEDRDRVLGSVSDAFSRGNGGMFVVGEGGEMKHFCNRFEADGMAFRIPDEFLFSFNSPLGACPVCGGLGKIIGISEDLVVPDKTKSIYDGAIACWRGEKMGWFKDHLVAVAKKYDIPIFEPYCNLSERVKGLVWNSRSVEGDETSIVGINEFFEWVETQRYKIQFKYMLSRFSGKATCNECQGTRLRREALYVRVAGKTIADVLSMNIDDALTFFEGLRSSEELDANEKEIVAEPLNEIISRLKCVQDVGLGYLTLSRTCNTLSGGESQRANLVTALGSSLVGSMYILDEPSIGLHPRDTEKLIGVLKRLRDLGNTVIVVEHDEEIIRAADMLIDMGPRAGVFGGEVVFQGRIDKEVKSSEQDKSLTLQYIRGTRPKYERKLRPWQYSITVKGAMEHNLKDIDVKFPLGVLTVVTGVSGSGKSSLVGDILYPALYRRLNDAGDLPGVFRGLEGNLDRIRRVEYVDQNPLGRSSRSNAVTYLKAFDDIRKLLAAQQYAKINGFGPNYFSFNAEGGRCPECQGDGVVKIEMQFMADVTMVCEECGGKRFKPEVLEVRYRGKNIDDILNMSVDEAVEFFGKGKEPEAASIVGKLKPLQDVGLGYIGLGQSSSTLSGGESQRIKLAYFLSLGGGAKQEKVMFIFDEPTTGLHFYDVEKLLKSFDALLEAGHSLVVVEHNPDVIRNADWVIDLGPDAGDDGGQVVFEGTPEDLRKAGTFTSRYI